MRWLKLLFAWLVVAFVVLVIERYTGAFSWIFTAGHKFKNPLIEGE